VNPCLSAATAVAPLSSTFLLDPPLKREGPRSPARDDRGPCVFRCLSPGYFLPFLRLRPISASFSVNSASRAATLSLVMGPVPFGSATLALQPMLLARVTRAPSTRLAQANPAGCPEGS